MYSSWDCPLARGGSAQEMVLAFDHDRRHRVLILPPLFDEANKLRHQLSCVMRRLDRAGVDCFLPDLPGCNESTAPLADQTLTGWRNGVEAAMREFGATHLLAVRGGALLLPDKRPGWTYAPVSGAAILRAMVRARAIASREAGSEESSAAIHQEGRERGVVLAGWHIGPRMFRELEQARLAERDNLTPIPHTAIGGNPLWLRAEPDADPAQAEALARLISADLAG